MTTEQQACGLGAFLPMSCRGRAEAFARRLQSRLQHLGGSSSSEEPGDTEETWLTNQPHYPTNHQPRLNSTSSESDIFYDFDMDLESPGSPQEEATEADLKELVLNKRRGRSVKVDCAIQENESGVVSALTATSPGSDSSDGNYYDPESFEYPSVQPLSPLEEETNAVYRKCNGNGALQEINGALQSINGDKTELNGDGTEMNGDLTELKADLTEEYGTENKIEDSKELNGAKLCNGNEVSNGETVQVESMAALTNCVDETDHVGISVNGNTYSKFNGNQLETEEMCAAIAKLDAKMSAAKLGDSDSVTSPCVSTKELIIADTGNVVKDETKNSFTSMFTLKNECTIECPKTKYPLVKVTPIMEETKESDDDDDDAPPRRVQRCSSLKTGKTPPGTPGRKKIVRFADCLGLDLADVRTFLDEIPKVPTSAYEDLTNADLSLGNSTSSHSNSLMALSSLPKAEKILIPLFQQPGGCVDFLDKVRRQKVCLENAMVKDMITCMITGTVRVLNLDFNKSVHIRYTLDSWKTFADLQATYVMNSCDGFSDTFSFTLYAHTVQLGQRLEFAVRFQCHGVQYWDSNSGMNYVFQCLPPAGPTPSLSLAEPGCDRWASFY